MTTDATRIREAVVSRLATLPGYVGGVRRTPVPQLQPDKLPSLSVYIAGEQLTPDGDANAGEPRFVSEITISISDVRGFAETDDLDADQDGALDSIETRLLTDPTFVGFEAGLFEAISRITRRRMFPQGGETYLAELRLEMTFIVRVGFDPVVLDDFDTIRMTARPRPAGVNTPGISVDIDLTS